MNVNRGKDFENLMREACLAVPGVSVIRLHDQTTGYAGSKNPCDIIAYKFPYQYCLELKSVHGNLLPFSNITDFQWKSLLELSKVKGVLAGIVCWWIDKDITRYIPIETLQNLKDNNSKSIRYDFRELPNLEIYGEKKRVFFNYDMRRFFMEVENDTTIPR